MNEQYALQRLDLIAKRDKWPDYDHVPRLVTIPARSERTLDGQNQLHFIIEAPDGVSIESSAGLYDATNEGVEDQVEEHFGQIVLKNRNRTIKLVRFIQAIPRSAPQVAS